MTRAVLGMRSSCSHWLVDMHAQQGIYRNTRGKHTSHIDGSREITVHVWSLEVFTHINTYRTKTEQLDETN